MTELKKWNVSVSPSLAKPIFYSMALAVRLQVIAEADKMDRLSVETMQC